MNGLQLNWCLSAADWRALDRYVAAHPAACFGHSPMWRRAVWRCYRLPQLALVARRGDEVVGAAPWTLLISPLVGPYLAVAPYASYGDLLADDALVSHALLERTTSDARLLGLRYAQLRCLHARPPLGALAGQQNDQRFVTARLELSGEAERVWRSRLHQKTRNQIRKARRLGVTVQPVADWADFEQVFLAGTRALGSPFHGRPFFAELRRQFGQQLAAWVARTAAGEPAAAALAIRHRDVMHYVYGQNVRQHRPCCANSLALWTLIEHACATGSKWVDLGRSERGTSAERFKRKWGASYLPLQETMLLVWRRRVPNVNPTNPALGRIQRAWSRLPAGVARRLGPLLIRGIA